MSDEPPTGDITASHPTARHLRAADEPPATAIDGRPLSATFPAHADLPVDTVSYGPDIPNDRTFRLLGNLEGKRVLELGCGGGHAAVAMAKQGAKVISIDPSSERIDRVRALLEQEETKVELRQGDLADLAWVRADTVDAVVSIYALATVDDPDRVYRQVHRVLRRECPLVLSVPHPAFAMVDPAASDPLRVARSYWSRDGRPWEADDLDGVDYPRPISEIFTSLGRANFRVDTILEPEPDAGTAKSASWSPVMAWVPSTLVVRARKEGI